MGTMRVWSGSPFEERVGYCRAVRVDDHIWVAGTAPFLEDGSIAAPGDLGGQLRHCLAIIRDALVELGSGPEDVVVTRMYVTDISRTAEVADPHREMFGDNPPAATLVEVSALVHPDILIEVEVEARVRDE
jgi:enamine deaminase RidA (YjgF/YER057c/UK114 family)